MSSVIRGWGSAPLAATGPSAWRAKTLARRSFTKTNYDGNLLTPANRAPLSPPPAPARPSGTLQFLGVANLIVCGLFAIMSVPFFMGQMRVLRDWPQTQAQILGSEVVVQPAAKHEQLYAAKLQILYVVKQQAETVELISFQSKDYGETARRAADFPVGSRHPVRYDPANPAQARIGAGWNRRFFAVPLITLGIGLAFGGIALGCFIAGRLLGTPPKTIPT